MFILVSVQATQTQWTEALLLPAAPEYATNSNLSSCLYAGAKHRRHLLGRFPGGLMGYRVLQRAPAGASATTTATATASF